MITIVTRWKLSCRWRQQELCEQINNNQPSEKQHTETLKMKEILSYFS